MALLKDLDELDTNGERGDWCFINEDTYIAIRYGEDIISTVVLPITGNSGWKWNGNRDSPTLSPSILVYGKPDWNEGWHGWLRNGILETA